jgi:hypothetical protein
MNERINKREPMMNITKEKKLMKRALVLTVMLTLAVFGLQPAAVNASVVLQLEDAAVQRDGAPVSGRAGSPSSSWKGEWRGKVKNVAEYLSFDLADNPLNVEEGAITATVIRGEQYQHEALFTLVDAAGSPVFGVELDWPTEEGAPLTLAYPGDTNFIENFTFVPVLPDAGEELKVSVVWTVDSFSVYVGGVQLETVLREDISVFKDALSRTARLLVGIEPDPRYPEGGYSQLVSEVTDFKVFNGAPAAGQGIISVTHDGFAAAGYSGKLVAGDSVTVIMKADPYGSASFDITGLASGVPMVENASAPGTYIGEYVIAYGDDMEEGVVTGSFTDFYGNAASPFIASKALPVDSKVYLGVNASNDLVPADETARSGITVIATDANGKEVRDHQLKLTMSTTDEYTGTVGGGTFEDNVGGSIDVDWGGVTDSFGEVTAQYLSGFAAKTILVSAKDMNTGDVGVGYIRSYIDGTVDVVVKQASATALSLAGSMEVSLSREWLTADGRSRSRITAVIEDADGEPASGHNISFNLFGNNGKIRVVQGKTDSRGRARADYIAGTVMGQVQIEVRDMTSGLSQIVSIELRPDAPAEIALGAEPGEVTVGESTDIMALVTDVNSNPNDDVDVLYDIVRGSGVLGADSSATDEDGKASVTFTGSEPGITTIRGTVISRAPIDEEISAAEGAVFLFGLDEDPGDLEVIEWLAEAGDEVAEGQGLVVLEDRDDNLYTVTAPRDGVLSVFVAEERDDVEYGDTLAYVIEDEE